MSCQPDTHASPVILPFVAVSTAPKNGNRAGTWFNPVVVEGDLRSADLKEAARLAADRNQWFHGARFLILPGVVSMAVVAVMPQPWIGVTCGSALLIATTLFCAQVNRRCEVRRWQAHDGPLAGHHSARVTETQIETLSGSSSRLLSWEGICGYRQSEKMMVLFFDEMHGFHVFPRSLFQHDCEWETFLRLVHNKVSANGYSKSDAMFM